MLLKNPIINVIAFEGNDKLKDEDLAAEISLSSRQVLSKPAVAADVERLSEIYRRRGRYNAVITPQVIELDAGRANLVFLIDEGTQAKISRIAFAGNKEFSDKKLREVIVTQQRVWFRFWTSRDKYDPDRTRFDSEQLRSFYLSQGYADMAVTSAIAELTEDKKSFILTFTVDEGKRYKVGGIRIDSAVSEVTDTSHLLENVDIKEGQWYNADKVTEASDKITDALEDERIVFVSVKGGLIKKTIQDEDAKNPVGTVAFRISPAPRLFVERIEIAGNTRTHDDVIRREISIVEGDPLNRERIDLAKRRVQSLGFFESVQTKVLPGSAPNTKIVRIDVVEQSTGDISFGAGFSTTDGILGDFRITERNLLGRGYNTSLGFNISEKTTDANFSISDPYFLNRDLLAGFDVFTTTRDLQDESSFDKKSTGFALRLGYPLSENWRQTVKYRLEDNEVSNVQNDASRFIKDQEGSRLTSAISQRAVYDKRDVRINTTEGWYYWLDTDLAGIGGDAQYVSAKTGATFYHSIRPSWIVSLTGEGGIVEGYGGDIPNIAERFYVGGNNMRGFERGGLGPRDLSTDDALGGKYFMRSSLELTMPTFMPKEYGLRAHLFSDAGTLWGLDDGDGGDDPNVVSDLKWRASVGFGISWDSPMGPIRMDITNAFLKEDYDKTESFRFGFGTRF